MSTILIFLIVIVFLVVAHELGHFFIAKIFGMRVEAYSFFGLGPRLFDLAALALLLGLHLRLDLIQFRLPQPQLQLPPLPLLLVRRRRPPRRYLVVP